jgi:DNA-binding transcriptional LysR family regulator
MASPIGQTVAAGLQAHGITPSVVMTLESVEAIKAFVAAGMGYAAVSGRSVARELHEGRLVALAPEGLSLARQFGLASRPEASRSAAVAAFLEHMS